MGGVVGGVIFKGVSLLARDVLGWWGKLSAALD
jgi:hypothetical protein